MSERSFLKVDDLVKRFGDDEVLTSISFEVMPAQVMVICGPSGCGKSTLLRCINGLEKIDGGQIWIDGRPVSGASKEDMLEIRLSAGLVFQNFNLFPHMTVLRNITIAPVKNQNRNEREVEEEARELLRRVGMPEKADQYPYELSGGQRQRVAIARALAVRPKLMMFDEPTSALDPEMRDEVLNVIRKLREEEKMTMIVVTHEVGFGRDVGDQAMLIDDGTIVEMGRAEEFFREPKQDRTRQFLKAIINA